MKLQKQKQYTRKKNKYPEKTEYFEPKRAVSFPRHPIIWEELKADPKGKEKFQNPIFLTPMSKKCINKADPDVKIRNWGKKCSQIIQQKSPKQASFLPNSNTEIRNQENFQSSTCPLQLVLGTGGLRKREAAAWDERRDPETAIDEVKKPRRKKQEERKRRRRAWMWGKTEKWGRVL